uniref:Uncharacterized protein n=1 Tax=Timema monikensis TaxID=170555 RepID=A0A7R9EN10_9NEOP|nr:unnamed protein product [Timema monikensis]
MGYGDNLKPRLMTNKSQQSGELPTSTSIEVKNRNNWWPFNFNFIM